MSISTYAQGLSFVQYVADGVVANFPLIFDYLDQAHVKVYVNSTEVSYTWLNAAEVTPTVLPINGDVVTIRRFTKSDARLVDFQDGGQVSERLLDTDSNQLFYLTQESQDVSNFGLGVDPLNFTVDARGNRLINVGDAVDPTDGINLGQIQDLITAVESAGTQAAQAAADAETAANDALGAQQAAAAVLATAQSAVDAVNAHIADSTDAHDASAISTVPAGNLAASDVQSALDELQSDVDTRATSAALATHTSDSANPHSVTKAQVGLGNADNTADIDKPVSTAQAAAIAQAKADIVDSSPATLDTLNELATALGDDPNFATTTATSLGNRLRVDTAAQGLSGTQKTNAKSNLNLDHVDNLSADELAARTENLTNKTITGPTIIAPIRSDVKQDTKANLLTYAASAANGQSVWATDEKKGYWVKDGTLDAMGSGSGSGGINYITNYTLETDTNGFAVYADAAGTSPVDGTGGSPASLIARLTSSPLRGTASLSFSKSAANRQGEGFSYDFTIDASDKGKVLQGSLEYQIATGTYADNDLAVYIYDVTNARMIQPTPYLIKNSTIIEKFAFEFQTAIDSTSYRLIVHVASTSAVAYSVKFDNFSVGPQSKLYGSAVTDWVAYTATITNLGTSPTQTCYWKRSGGDILIRGDITPAATVGGSPATLSLPNSLVSAVTNTKFGGTLYQAGTAGGTNQNSVIILGSTNAAITFGVQSAGAAGLTPLAASSMFLAGTQFSFSTSIPIQGWSSSQIMSSEADTRVVSFSGNGTGSTQALTANVTNINVTATKDSHGAWASGVFTVPVPGDYQVSAFLYSGASSFNAQVYVNGNPKKYISYCSANLGGGGSVIVDNLKAGDLLSIRSAATVTLSADTQQNIGISRISGPAQIMASETVAAEYSTATAQSTSTGTIIDFNVKEFDTHNAVTTGAAWKFTAPISGIYQIAISLQWASAAYNTATFEANLFKNGTTVTASSLGTFFHSNGITMSPSINGMKNIKLVAGEYIQVNSYETNGAPANLSGTSQYNHVSIVRIGNY